MSTKKFADNIGLLVLVWLLYCAGLAVLFSCGQTNQAVDCMRAGNQCADTIKGEPGEPGLPGRDGTDGSNGRDGANGNDGAPGPIGSPGRDGSIITPVIPCPQTQGNFPEVLLCIDQRLYAVFDGYQAQDTRYVEVVPGPTYQTTDGRACTFRVVSGCEIQ